jgi:hypothetical protein
MSETQAPAHDLATIAAGVRNATLDDAVALLIEQKARKIDVVASAESLRFKNGSAVVKGLDVQINDDGVTDPNGLYRPTAAADAQIAERLEIGTKYIRKLRDERIDLFDINVNGLLGGKARVTQDGERQWIYPADQRNFLLRCFRGDEGQEGMLRGFLSDRFGIIDHLDVLTAVLDGITQAGVQVETRQCDLTDSFINVRMHSPQVAELAPTFLGGYSNPFENPELEKARKNANRWLEVARREGEAFEAGNEPVMFAGFRFTNSETGNGKYTLMPDLYVKICKNGLTLPLFGTEKTHLGSKLDEGWGFEVQHKHLELITAQAKEKVATWLSPAFLAARVGEIEEQAGAPVTYVEKTMKAVATTCKFTDEERDGILAHFVAGRQGTVAGIANAVTSYSQTVHDAQRANQLDGQALKAMAAAAKV